MKATSDIKLDGTLIIPTPLFEVLDGQVHNRTPVFRKPYSASNFYQVTADYVQRVEPSAQVSRRAAACYATVARVVAIGGFNVICVQGGKKMAGLFMKLMQQHAVLPAHNDT